MDVSENGGTPKSAILIGFSIMNHPFWGTPIFGNTHMEHLPHEKQDKSNVDEYALSRGPVQSPETP